MSEITEEHKVEETVAEVPKQPFEAKVAFSSKSYEFLKAFTSIVEKMKPSGSKAGGLDGEIVYIVFDEDKIVLYGYGISHFTSVVCFITKDKLADYKVSGDNGEQNVIAISEKHFVAIIKMMTKGSGENRIDIEITPSSANGLLLKRGKRKADIRSNILNMSADSVRKQTLTFTNPSSPLLTALTKFRVPAKQLSDGIEGTEIIQDGNRNSYTIFEYDNGLLQMRGKGDVGLFGTMLDHTLLTKDRKVEKEKTGVHLEYITGIDQQFPTDNIDIGFGTKKPLLLESTEAGMSLMFVMAPRILEDDE